MEITSKVYLEAAAANTERPSVDERAESIAERSLSKGVSADMFAPTLA